jgi:serine/threonine protein kinase
LPVVDILRISLQIASGLAAAHHQGLVHHDIKPANILMGDGVDRLVITDFGLVRAVDDASVTRTGVIAGTPQYMSPEQARGESVDARSDLFSLGSVMYAMCTGRVPFRAESPYGVLRRITDNVPRPIRDINPDISPWLCSIVERLHAKSAADRFQSAEVIAELLTQCLAHVSQPTIHPLPQELQPTGRHDVFKRRSVQVAIVFGVLTTVAFLGYTSMPPQVEAIRHEEIQQHSITELWKPPNGNINDWNDNLTPIFRDIEQSLKTLTDERPGASSRSLLSRHRRAERRKSPDPSTLPRRGTPKIGGLTSCRSPTDIRLTNHS